MFTLFGEIAPYVIKVYIMYRYILYVCILELGLRIEYLNFSFRAFPDLKSYFTICLLKNSFSSDR